MDICDSKKTSPYKWRPKYFSPSYEQFWLFLFYFLTQSVCRAHCQAQLLIHVHLSALPRLYLCGIV